ncbi:exosome complex exonuclease RRP44 homolog A [Tanacetum coccineum]
MQRDTIFRNRDHQRIFKNSISLKIDLLENTAIDDVVVLSVVLEEVRNKNLGVYNRLRALCSNSLRRFFVFSNEHHKTRLSLSVNVTGHRDTYVKAMTDESPNDRNDRAIRVAAQWYQNHLGSATKILMITNDRENKRKATEEGISSETVESYVKSLGQPALLDLLVQPHTSEDMEIEDLRPSKKKVIYTEHKPMSEITSGMRCGIYHQGKLRVNHPSDAYSIANSTQGYVDNANNAPSRPSGRVVGIIKYNWHAYCGSLEPMAMPAGNAGIAHALFVSKDRRFPKIRIQTRQLGSLLDKRFIVAVDTWDCQSRYPSGHYVRTIGDIGDRETETKVVLIENDIDAKPFTSQVLAFLPALPCVDPPGCKDIDDALHCTSLPNGNFEVGVYIADVTNFVHPGTPLDSEATQRGTSTYLVERHICSLRADVERLAFSVLREMTSDAHAISTRYTKSVIKSCAALSYVEAQLRMDDSRLLDPITMDLRNMNMLAKVITTTRIYPKGTVRCNDSIFKPLTAWLHGAQMVAFNMQSVRRRLLDEGTCATKVQVHTLRHRNAYDRIREGRGELLQPGEYFQLIDLGIKDVLALMIARPYTSSHDIISLRNRYHGNVSATMAVTAQRNYKYNVVHVRIRNYRSWSSMLQENHGPTCSAIRAAYVQTTNQTALKKDVVDNQLPNSIREHETDMEVDLSPLCLSLENALAVCEERVPLDAVTGLCLLFLGLFFLSHDSNSENWVCEFRYFLLRKVAPLALPREGDPAIKLGCESKRVSLSDAWITMRGSPYYPMGNGVVVVRSTSSRVNVCRGVARDCGPGFIPCGVAEPCSLPLRADYDSRGTAKLMLLAAVCRLCFLRGGWRLVALDPFRRWAWAHCLLYGPGLRPG